MKKVYTARFFDYYGWEMEEHTKKFDTLIRAREYLLSVCNEKAIPFAQLDRDDQAINLCGKRIGANCDSRRY